MLTHNNYKEALMNLILMLDESALRENVMRELYVCPYIMKVAEKIANIHLSK